MKTSEISAICTLAMKISVANEKRSVGQCISDKKTVKNINNKGNTKGLRENCLCSSALALEPEVRWDLKMNN